MKSYKQRFLHRGGSDQNQIQENRKCKKAKWLSVDTLQTIEKRREVKGKGEKERYTHLKAKSKEQQRDIRKSS